MRSDNLSLVLVQHDLESAIRNLDRCEVYGLLADARIALKDALDYVNAELEMRYNHERCDRQDTRVRLRGMDDHARDSGIGPSEEDVVVRLQDTLRLGEVRLRGEQSQSRSEEEREAVEEDRAMSHIRTFDDTLLSEAVTYINVAMKKLKAMEEQTPRSEQALSLLEYAKDEALTEINVRCETRKGKLLGEN